MSYEEMSVVPLNFSNPRYMKTVHNFALSASKSDRSIMKKVSLAACLSETNEYATEMPVGEPITNKVKMRVYLSVSRPIKMLGSETWTAPSAVMARLEKEKEDA
ncbi:hypothetical protein RB195_025739 [Necator americanus]|uniref:Uncharacterized protein n=1 Tax=Necator americanus TaxID=51031 RepID=A0ABR1ETM8_NECAM